jgi:hypothetical protein
VRLQSACSRLIDNHSIRLSRLFPSPIDIAGFARGCSIEIRPAVRQTIDGVRKLEGKCCSSRSRLKFYDHLAAVFEIYVQMRRSNQAKPSARRIANLFGLRVYPQAGHFCLYEGGVISSASIAVLWSASGDRTVPDLIAPTELVGSILQSLPGAVFIASSDAKDVRADRSRHEYASGFLIAAGVRRYCVRSSHTFTATRSPRNP